MDPESSFYFGQGDNGTAEMTFKNEQLEPADVEDILERLHIGTLRRDELKKKKTAAEADNSDEEINRSEESARNKTSVFTRQDSKASRSSYDSIASGSSDDPQFSRQSSSSSVDKKSDRHSSTTTEMGIQTTLGRQFKPSDTKNDEHKSSSKKEKKSSSKDKKKRLFRRKSSTTEANQLAAVPELPQGFLAKYMGKRPTKGLWGSKHTRKHVEDIVDSIGHLPKNEDLPLVNIEVHYQGLVMRPHSKNKIKSFKEARIPIQYISYGLQDTIYPRIFCFIMVTEMSSQKKSMECHVYACDSAKSAYELAACLALAFQAYSEQLQQGAYKFNVEIAMKPDDDDTPESCDV